LSGKGQSKLKLSGNGNECKPLVGGANAPECLPGTYSIGSGYNLTCHQCPAQSSCDEVGFTLDNFPVSRGHFRFSAHSAELGRA
jgi:hypothetical protein